MRIPAAPPVPGWTMLMGGGHGRTLQAIERAKRVALAAEEKKAAEITVLEVRELTPVADYFVICSGHSRLQVQAIADAILEAMEGAGQALLHMEGYDRARWVLLDFGDVVAHIFLAEEREYYDIERLWREAPRMERLEPIS